MPKMLLHLSEEITNELSKLNRYEDICIDALKHLPDTERKEITTLLRRMFIAEREYLADSPEMYFELYKEIKPQHEK